MHLTYRNTCRVCGSSALTKVVDLGEQFLQGSFIKLGKKPPPMRKIPTVLVQCDPSRDEKACGLLQMAHSVPPSILYSVYWYRSGTNQTMRDHLKGITDEAVKMVKKANSSVLDIGCNDGTLLRCYPEQFLKYGVDPSDVAKEIGGNIRIIKESFPSEQLKAEVKDSRFDIITSIAMFYDIEDPVGFVANIRNCLSEEGIWIFEMSYMPLMLKLNSYDTICHEHLEYYSFAVLENILKRADMKIVRASLNEINGGSIRCCATKIGNRKLDDPEFAAQLDDLRKAEFDLELDTYKPYIEFQKRIEGHKIELLSLLNRIKSDGKRIHVYGASTKGNTILQWCGIDKSIIDYAADRNPDKHGTKTVGTDIPIISEDESRKLMPDYYLVLPWHFKKEFLEREKDMMAKGTGMIFPLPSLEIVRI